ncbi:MAG: adenylate kinase family protein [Capsulimonadaceae bacterium]
MVLLGLPGAGKGTQGGFISRYYGIPHVATGDIIRDHIARRTEFGQRVESAIAGGNFAPDNDILYWVFRRLANADALSGYVLDGFPRDIAQAEEFDKHLHEMGQRLDAAIDLVIDESDLIMRLSGRLICPVCAASYHIVSRPPAVPGLCDIDGAALVRRPDDDPEAIKRRFVVYHTVTSPLREYYRATGRYEAVDGGGPAEAVFERARGVLDARIHGAAG